MRSPAVRATPSPMQRNWPRARRRLRAGRLTPGSSRSRPPPARRRVSRPMVLDAEHLAVEQGRVELNAGRGEPVEEAEQVAGREERSERAAGFVVARSVVEDEQVMQLDTVATIGCHADDFGDAGDEPAAVL